MSTWSATALQIPLRKKSPFEANRCTQIICASTKRTSIKNEKLEPEWIPWKGWRSMIGNWPDEFKRVCCWKHFTGNAFLNQHSTWISDRSLQRSHSEKGPPGLSQGGFRHWKIFQACDLEKSHNLKLIVEFCAFFNEKNTTWSPWSGEPPTWPSTAIREGRTISSEKYDKSDQTQSKWT